VSFGKEPLTWTDTLHVAHKTLLSGTTVKHHHLLASIFSVLFNFY
jgi:hypothetical protein